MFRIYNNREKIPSKYRVLYGYELKRGLKDDKDTTGDF